MENAADDLSGRRFGRLVVVERVFKAERGWRWSCHCDCGQKVIAHDYTLLQGTTYQCWRCIQAGIVGACSVCGERAWARGLCHPHYLYWRDEHVKGAREKRLTNQKSQYQQRVEVEGSEWKIEKNRKARAVIPDWYVRQCRKLPDYTPKDVIERHRQEIRAQREARRAMGVRGPGAKRKTETFQY